MQQQQQKSGIKSSATMKAAVLKRFKQNSNSLKISFCVCFSYASEYSSRYSRPMISRGPTYDKYGKELSNYDRWRMQNSSGATSTANSEINNNYNHSATLDTVGTKARRRISRIEDDSTSMGSGGSILTTSRYT